MPTPEIFERNAQELKDLAQRYHQFQNDPESFLRAIHQKDKAELRLYLEDSEPYVTKVIEGENQISPVNFLRHVVITRILKGESVSSSDIKELERRIDEKDLDYFADFTQYLDLIARQKERKRSAFGSWDLFKELFYIDYSSRSSGVKKQLEQMAQFIKETFELEEADWHLAGFDHNQNYGTDWCWIALFPNRMRGHKTAYQIFFSVKHDGYKYGLGAGSQVEDRQSEDKHVMRPNLDLEQVVELYRKQLPRYFDLNQRLEKKSASSDGAKAEPNFPLNLILYGPPGTGKTYSVQRRAVQIIEGTTADLTPKHARDKFQRYTSDRRIEFVTFHPSYSYEEFVEGFRYDEEKKIPILKDGLLKRIVERALNPRDGSIGKEQSQIWKVSLGGPSDAFLFERCITKNEIAIGWYDEVDLTDMGEDEIQQLFEEDGNGQQTNSIRSINYFVNEMAKGDYVAILKDQKTIRAIGVVDDVYRYRGEYDKYKHTRPVIWLDKRDHDIYKMNGNKIITMPAIYKLDRIAFQDFIGLLPPRKQKPEPYVLIIDEINRGNISRIFGELITLLEPDKRRGAQNQLTVRLPYSQEPFTVPENVYVIGTMNSADRSIALIDVALRRRFEFEEMMPDVDIIQKTLSGFLDDENKDVELTQSLIGLICQVFELLNQRITVLLDRDHQIGHSFFMNIRSVLDLHRVLYRQVFPTLQEYFYNDRERLARLLGGYDDSKSFGFVETMTKVYQKAFRGNSNAPGETPWKLHVYAVGELEDALRNTFGLSKEHGA